METFKRYSECDSNLEKEIFLRKTICEIRDFLEVLVAEIRVQPKNFGSQTEKKPQPWENPYKVPLSKRLS